MLKAISKKIYTGALFVLLGSIYFCDVFLRIFFIPEPESDLKYLFGAVAIIVFGLIIVIKNVLDLQKLDFKKEGSTHE